MDDIYTDLDNYNDVNIVEELKNENKELKFKLEEYSSAMHQLQKNILQDFDKLNVEYKNLEKNYSSLLKTARAEIERKTETIKNLNLEKDKLVLNSLQMGKNILHNRRSNFRDTQHNKKNTEDNSCLKEVKKIIKKSAECLDNELPVNRQPSVETVSSVPTDCKSACNENKISKTEFDNKISKESCVRSRDGRDKSYTKDNVPEKPSVRKVMNRRKSIPNFGDCEPAFSSDDDSRKTNLEQQQGDIPLADEDIRHFERHYEQQDYVQLESFDHYQPPTSLYRNRGNRYNDFERQRNYESYDKSRRNYSTDNHHRYGRECLENHNQRDYKDNKRRLEKSSPTDRYDRSKSRDRRYNFERENYRDYGRHSNHSEHFSAKNTSKFELEEPSSKRPKVDSYNRHTEHNFNHGKERELSERYYLAKPQESFQPSSCQSPDYINIDSNALHHSIKEIRHTSLTPLPDPRLLSNKYILTSNSKKPILATVAGSNVDIIPISNPTWGEDKQQTSVKTNPKEVDFVSEIYMDIENSGKSPSLESGEIQSLDEDHYATNYSNIAKTKDSEKSNVHKSHQNIAYFSATKEVEKTFINKYKIPHLKRHNVSKESNVTQEQQDVSKKKLHAFVKDFKVVVEGKHLSEKGPEDDSNNIANTDAMDNEKRESILQRLVNEKKINEKSDPTKFRRSDKIVNISTIEGDLELSDETSDNMDLIKEDTKVEKTDHLPKKELHTSSEKLKDRANKSDDKVKKSKDSKKSSHSKKEHVKEKIRDSSKKRKNRKQADQEGITVAKDDISPQTKINKKKDYNSSSSSQRNNKFTDLFGDSNSLITPDDLGLSNVIADKYVSAFENTQDAVDLSVEDITIVKARKSIDKTNTEEQINQQISHDTINIANSNHLNSNENHKSEKSTSLYENTNSETDTSNIVKTVIISTGIQPQHILQDMDEVPPPTNISEKSEVKKSAINTIKAIATSTPYKIINPIVSQTTIDSTITKKSVNTKDNLDATGLSTTDNSLTTITSDNKYESDIPDVRIFVRRRKKATKKPT